MGIIRAWGLKNTAEVETKVNNLNAFKTKETDNFYPRNLKELVHETTGPKDTLKVPIIKSKRLPHYWRSASAVSASKTVGGINSISLSPRLPELLHQWRQH